MWRGALERTHSWYLDVGPVVLATRFSGFYMLEEVGESGVSPMNGAKVGHEISL